MLIPWALVMVNLTQLTDFGVKDIVFPVPLFASCPTVTEVPTKAKVERAKVRGEEMTNSAAQ